MKRDLKPFVVEVKRGTRRSSFLGHLDQSSTMSEAQRRAEAALFAPTLEDATPKNLVHEPSRRILPSLVEPAPSLDPSPPDEQDLAYRPRPVGRPRKIRPPVAITAQEPPLPARAAAPPRLPASRVVEPAAPQPVTSSPPQAQPPVAEPPSMATIPEGRTRLRDRSAILARYVHGTKPAPGEKWSKSARREGRKYSE